MPAADFQQVLSKLRWSRQKLSELDDAITEYIRLEPYVSVVEDKPEAKEWVVIARLIHDPPTDIAHIVGDALNSLHGTLDYLAWQLALREGEAPDGRTFFPILTDAPKEGTAEERVNIFRAGERRRDAQVPMIKDRAVLQLLQKVQPYNNTEGEDAWRTHPLQVLRSLNGESKHRHPAVVASAASPPAINVYGNTVQLSDPRRRVQDGDEVAALPYELIPDTGQPPNVELRSYVTLEHFATRPRDDAPFPLIVLMLDMVRFVERFVVAPFSRLPWP